MKRMKAFREIGKEVGLWKHGYALAGRCKQVFRKIEPKGKRVLEIGCGRGLYCIYSSLMDAREVIGLEPLAEGTNKTDELFVEFRLICQRLSLQNTRIVPTKLQDFSHGTDPFDLVLSRASINHIDEQACVNLKGSSEAQEKYLKIFKRLGAMMVEGGKIVIIDASNRNYFADRGRTNPFARSIEWHKHQPPELWASLLSRSGFCDPKITWNSGTRLRYLGILSIPRRVSYYWKSMFRLEMTFEGDRTSARQENSQQARGKMTSLEKSL